ncbi:fluoride efflux transporter FluC [Levilactobacillus namurensis]|uniref:fluoride efflux transporter FluC n=1 Tax=Levilactobacillus namurensis TaxID=380393 RepID=UPI001D80D678|nr:CrcB family protein [Levilactobacillus namurensis]HJE45918.1 CrcB family protein [Levilactobacillus namurensis]
MITALLVCCAGGGGALCRFGLTLLGNRLFYDTYFPFPTLIINVVAATLLGMGAGWLRATSLAFQVLSGFLGGFSTYSTFTTEFTDLLHTFPKVAAGYIGLSVVLGIGGAFLGFWWVSA